MRYFKLLVMVAVMLLAAPASAQEPIPRAKKAKKGALLFSLNGITAAPGSFDNIGIGGRYVLDRKMTARGSLGIFNHSFEREVSPGNTPKQEVTQSRYTVEGGVELLLFGAEPVTIYGGVILQLGLESEEPQDKVEESARTLTVAGVIGANYFFAERLSLGAEYRLGIMYRSYEHEDKTGSETRTTEETTTDFGVGSVGFILGFWF